MPRRLGTRTQGRLSVALAVGLICTTVAISTVAIISINSVIARVSPHGPWGDWQTYALAVERHAAGESPYAPAQLEGPYELDDVVLRGYAYPPPSLLFMAPFHGGGGGLIAWLLINAMLLVLGLALIAERELGVRPVWAVAIVTTGLAILPPFLDGMAAGNVNVGLAGLVAISWVTGPHHLGTLVLAVTGGIIKVFPGALIAWYSHRRPMLVPRGLLVVAAALVASVAVQGWEIWRDYFVVIGNAVPSCDRWPDSVACILKPVLGMETARLLTLALGGLLIAVSVVIPRSGVAIVVLIAGMMLPIFDFWLHYGLFISVGAWLIGALAIKHLLKGRASFADSLTATGKPMVDESHGRTRTD